MARQQRQTGGIDSNTGAHIMLLYVLSTILQRTTQGYIGTLDGDVVKYEDTMRDELMRANVERPGTDTDWTACRNKAGTGTRQ